MFDGVDRRKWKYFCFLLSASLLPFLLCLLNVPFGVVTGWICREEGCSQNVVAVFAMFLLGLGGVQGNSHRHAGTRSDWIDEMPHGQTVIFPIQPVVSSNPFVHAATCSSLSYNHSSPSPFGSFHGYGYWMLGCVVSF
ncbi:uncharacterized protein B0T23DRAFT_25766 [Neurospora hispaniola]|uniref:Uncharacterized protein n=1 Tax=Neurospora hispaniola TaxID=588809 RepID=A0AAJ0MW00_9PEZI|nr:hypothetical protein B0T23DRAFT_25766 [Neurospora hispaniola]